MRVEEGFAQVPYELKNAYTSDPALRHLLHRLFSSSSSPLPPGSLHADLESFAERVQDEARPLAKLCDVPGAEPKLVQYDQWGKRVDQLITCEGWRKLKDWAAKEGIVAEAYSNLGWDEVKQEHIPANTVGGRDKLGALARVYSFARAYLFAPDSRVVMCPASMQDGAIRVLELYGTESQREANLPRLLSRETAPGRAWTAGQWMTERPGGSDVSMTETVAKPLIQKSPGDKAKPGDQYILNGFKWFSSATDGDVALALARTDPDPAKGSRGLSLFLVRLRDDKTGKLNGIRVHRLKNKLGTNMVPTAELELEGCLAELVGQEGRGEFQPPSTKRLTFFLETQLMGRSRNSCSLRSLTGVACIASVLNITRLYSANGTVAALGRGLQIATSYAQVRRVGTPGVAPPGSLLASLPLHTSRLARIAVLHRALLQLVFHVIHLLGASEARMATPADEARLRLLTPVCKAFAATRASEGYLSCIESLGGAGYMTENELGTLLRDGTVERIWEGTPSVLSLDVARVIAQTRGASLVAFCDDAQRDLDKVPDDLAQGVAEAKQALRDAISRMHTAAKQAQALMKDARIARALLDLLGIVTSGVLLLQQAAWAKDGPADERGNAEVEAEVARRWILGEEGGLVTALRELNELSEGKGAGGKKGTQMESAIVFGAPNAQSKEERARL